MRLIIFGHTAVAMAIDPREIIGKRVDWRSGPLRSMKTWIMQVDSSLIEQCRTVMAELGIVFGAFDFALDSQGEFSFFEVNEAGQFLFIEDLHPSVHLAAEFANFLKRSGVA